MRHRLGHRVRQTAGADVVHEQNRIERPARRAAVDDLLRAPLDFRIATLHRGEIEIGAGGAAVHRRRRSAAETDQHRRPAEHDDFRTHRNLALLHVLATHVAETAGDHDGLVITADAIREIPVRRLLESAEVACDVGPAEFIVERSAADGTLVHDLERRDDAIRLAHFFRMRGLLPGLQEARDAQVRDRKSCETGLGFGSASRGAFVANLAAGSGRRSGERRDRGRVIVSLDLHENVDGLVDRAVDVVLGIREVAFAERAFHDGGVVAIR